MKFAEAQFMFAIDIFPQAAFAIPLKEVKPRITKAESNIFLPGYKSCPHQNSWNDIKS
jgi:hypothetical protein